MGDLESNKEEDFADSNYGWSYGKNYSGKVKTYKFGDENESFVAAGSISTGNSNNVDNSPKFSFRTAESFLNNINKKENTVDISIYKQGQKVYHKKFGEGIINSIEQEGDDAKVDISFDKVGHKRLMAKYAGLEIID